MQDNQPLIPAAIYARVSSVRQAAPDLRSFQTQTDECLKYASAHGFTVPIELQVQEAHTGRVTMHRPKLEALVDLMVRTGVRHIIMDEGRRVTREGQAAAGHLLYYLTQHGVTLHLATENLAIVDDAQVHLFLTYAFIAKRENADRVYKSMRNKRQYAREYGRFPIAPRPPYGWLYEPVGVNEQGRPHHYRLVHDPDTYPTLLLMLRMRQAGRSWHGITRTLNREGIPLPSEKAVGWSVLVVKRIVENPVNGGRWEAFRTKQVEMPADTRHPDRWVKTVPTDSGERIKLPDDYVVEPPLSWPEYEAMVAIGARGPRKQPLFASSESADGEGEPQRPHPSEKALFRGGALIHTDCGYPMHVMSITGRNGITKHTYYSCVGAPHARRTCTTGFNAPTGVVDDLIWRVVRRLLLVPGRLEQVAEAQKQADTLALSRGEGLGGLQAAEGNVKRLEKEIERLIIAIRRADSDRTRQIYEREVSELEKDLAEAEQRLSEARVRAADDDHRRRVLSTAREQLARYAVLLNVLHHLPRNFRAPLQRDILRALGLRASITHAEGSRRGTGVQKGKVYDITVQMHLADALAQPWFIGQPFPVDLAESAEKWEEVAARWLPEMQAEAGVSAEGLAEGEEEHIESDGHVRFVFVQPTYLPGYH
jgi:Resolvase, N terminal domain/Recombinase